jgi:hypothetical protein
MGSRVGPDGVAMVAGRACPRGGRGIGYTPGMVSAEPFWMLEVPQPTVPATPAVPGAPVTPAVPDPGTPGQPEDPATVPVPREPPTPVVPDPEPAPDDGEA